MVMIKTVVVCEFSYRVRIGTGPGPRNSTNSEALKGEAAEI